MNDQTLTPDQALARVDHLIRDTATVLTPMPRLELITFGTEANECPSPAAEGSITINRAYWLRDIPKHENLRISQQVRDHWQARGHRITGFGGEGSPNLSGESQPDRYILALSRAEGDNLYLAATSPCISPTQPTR
ncbi:hypothetical protein [Nonomuraea typhae]|uniref:hypothetical protein n=1 Tax=Nonomuraea typhae TaxID=2603600 RepID=UPI0012F9C171|nr:hypothetical protein [Nonomuraea typhae]